MSRTDHMAGAASKAVISNSNPVIFLDVDGVLNVTKLGWQSVPPRRPSLPHGRKLVKGRNWHREPVEHLNRLLIQTSALLVLSSSWRLREGVRDILRGNGVCGPWHDDWRTDELPQGRGAEIARWLEANGHPRHVIIDDWPHELREHAGKLVLVNDRIGLTRELAAKAREILYHQRFTVEAKQ